MANTDNSCSNLEIKDTWTEAIHTPKIFQDPSDKSSMRIGSDTLGDILNLQAETQKNVYGYDFENMNLREIMNFWHMNTHAMIDEIHEATDALGGIKDGSGNAIWKRWKKNYHTFNDKKFSDLSIEDQLECKFEIVDMLHFFMNYAASIGMTSQEMYNLYMSKNLENRERQKNGY
jgi:hypothetical protein